MNAALILAFIALLALFAWLYRRAARNDARLEQAPPTTPVQTYDASGPRRVRHSQREAKAYAERQQSGVRVLPPIEPPDGYIK